MTLLLINIFGIICGIMGSCLGALFSFFVPNRKAILSIMIGWTAGLMLGMICFGLLPEAIEKGGMILCFVVILLTSFLIAILESKIEIIGKTKNNRYIKSGLLISFGIAMHNLPEGIAVGSSLIYDRKLGLLIALMIFLHDIPEGFAISIPLKLSGFSKWKILYISMMVGIPTGIGCIIGSIFGTINKQIHSFCIAFAASAMLYITISELMPEYKNLDKSKLPVLANILGIICAIILMEWE